MIETIAAFVSGGVVVGVTACVRLRQMKRENVAALERLEQMIQKERRLYRTTGPTINLRRWRAKERRRMSRKIKANKRKR